MAKAYWQILKNSGSLIKKGAPGPAYWSKTWDEIKYLWGGIECVLTQLFSLVLWIIITATFPVSLPLLSYLSYRHQGKRAAKRQAGIKAFEDAMRPNPKSTL
jgi:hypothetical protein